MIRYLIRDLWNAVQYLPYAMLAGSFICVIALCMKYIRKKKGKDTKMLVPNILFFTYLALLLIITFLSRDSNGNLRLDLQMGSSLGINSRNDAYVIENILLFIPYGFFWSMLRNRTGGFFSSLFTGLLTSWGIECLQLVSGRGIFQIDDIITNTLGCVIGFVLFKCIYGILKR